MDGTEKLSGMGTGEADWKYLSIFNNSFDAILLSSPGGGIYAANPAACAMFGRTEEEICLIGRDGIMNSEDPRLKLALEDRSRTGHFSGELTARRNDGTIFPVEITTFIFNDLSGNRKTFIIIRDISERKEKEAALALSEQRFRAITGNTPDHIILTDNDMRYTYVANPPSGLSVEEMLGKTDFDLFQEHEAMGMTSLKKEVLNRQIPIHFQTSLMSRKGVTEYFEGTYIPQTDVEGKPSGIIGYLRDVTQPRNAKRLNKATITILDLINKYRTRKELISRIVEFFREEFDISAVGIRLRQGEDYPYYETRGFHDDFVVLENRLCSYNADGEIRRDQGGNPLLECICGNILSNRFDCSHPFFTKLGSFWTNSTTELLASTTHEELQSATRNRCNGQGYESVALIPLKFGGNTFGLLQLNNKSKNKFSHEFILFCEVICDSIAVALDRIDIQEKLIRRETNIRTIIENTDSSIWSVDTGLNLTECNSVFKSRFFDLTGKEIREGENIIKKLSGRYAGEYLEYYRRALSGESFSVNHSVELHSGPLHLRHNFSPLRDNKGSVTGVIVTGTNITDLIITQEILRRSENRYRTLFENSVIPVWEEDFSGVKIFIDGLRRKRVRNFRKYFARNPEAAEYCANLIKVVNINQTSLEFFGVTAKEDIMPVLMNYFTDASVKIFTEEIIALAEGKREYECDIPVRLPDGDERLIHLRLQVQPDHSDTLSQVLVSWLDLTDRIKYEEELKRSGEILTNLNRHIEEARENERSKIALNLHDDLGQKLTALKMDLSWLEKRMGVQSEMVSGKLEAVKGLIDESVNIIQRISSDLRPGILYDLGLREAIEYHIKEHLLPHGINVSFVQIPPDLRLDEKISIIIFRIVQEALTNVIRHSGAGKVSVRITKSGSQLALTISDNGKGIREEEVNDPRSLGLAGMRERAKAISGEFSIKGKPGKGTILKIRIPII